MIKTKRFFEYLLILLFLIMTTPGCSYLNAIQKGAEDGYNPLSSVIHFYREPLNHLSPVRSGTCPMTPSCSEYANQSIQKHGPVIGYIMANDRLMRCGRDETRLSENILTPNGWRTHDPVEHNDAWWFKDEKTK